MKRDYNTLVLQTVGDVLRVDGCAGMTAEALSAYARLMAAIYMEAYLSDSGLCEQPSFLEKLGGLCAELQRCSSAPASLTDCAWLAAGLHELARTKLFPMQDVLEQTDRRLVSEVMSAGAADCHAVSVAMHVLEREPLTRCVWDDSAVGRRRYEFSIGGDYFNATLEAWAASQIPDGSWPEVGAEEAFSRIWVIGGDFGSLPQLDNGRVCNSAYACYAQRPSATPHALMAQYRACTARRGHTATDRELARFVEAACLCLADQTLSPAERLHMQYLVFAAGNRLAEVRLPACG